MEVIKGNLWPFYIEGYWMIVSTNGFVKNNKEAVMGRGIALEVAEKFPEFPGLFGRAMLDLGNTVMGWPKYRLITFPVKHHWKDSADLLLIEKSCEELKWYLETEPDIKKVVSPKVGCGNGNLDWKAVEPILNKHFDNDPRIIIVDRV